MFEVYRVTRFGLWRSGLPLLDSALRQLALSGWADRTTFCSLRNVEPRHLLLLTCAQIRTCTPVGEKWSAQCKLACIEQSLGVGDAITGLLYFSENVFAASEVDGSLDAKQIQGDLKGSQGTHAQA